MKYLRYHFSQFSRLAVCMAAVLVSSGAEKFIWSEGHGDLAVNYANGEWQWQAQEGKDPDRVIIRLGDLTRKEIPANPAFSFLGTAGDPIWIIPTGETAGIPFMGINAEATRSGTFVNNRFDLHLTSVSGPGDFVMWTTTGTGTPTILMNSRDGITISDKTDVPAGGHFHQNWGFTLPGTYRIGFKAAGVLTGQTTPTTSEETVYTFEVNVLKAGEVDIEVAYENVAIEFHIHDEVADVEFDPAYVALQAGPATWQTVPQSAAFSFLGRPGASIYVLPQDEPEGVLFLGLAAGEVSTGTFENDRLTIKLVAVEGPGRVAYYEIDQFGVPSVAFNSADGITAADIVTVAPGSHAHRNWSFSAPGVYRITLQASGTLTAGQEIRSEPATFLFEVLPPVFVGEGEIDFEVAFPEQEFELSLLDELQNRELSTRDAVLILKPAARQSVPNDPSFSFLGSAGAPVYVLPQEETEGLLFLGIAGDEIASGQFGNETVRLELAAVSGPGNFALYSVDAFGAPTVFINTRDGVSSGDAFPIAVGSHTHANWAFSQPGEYRLSFKASGTLMGENQATVSEPVTLRFMVEPGAPTVGPTLSAVLSSNVQQLEIRWEGKEGLHYQLQSRLSTSDNWTNVGGVISGRSGAQSIAVDLGTEVMKLYRLKISP
jgi:surface-anchored protein